ncbi:cytochrome c oxidase assembly protein [Virgibacillus soli]
MLQDSESSITIKEEVEKRCDEMIDIILSELHFSSIWNGGIFLFTLFGAIIYLFMLPNGKNHTIWKSIVFLVGLAITFLAIGSPLNIVARIQFSRHILQLILLLLLAPPLLIIGFKTEVLKNVASKPFLQKMCDLLTRPSLTFTLFFILLYAVHMPFLFDAVRMDIYTNYFYMLGLFIVALLFWIPLISEKKLNIKQKTIYAGASMVVFIPLSIFFYVAKTSLYTVYSDLSYFIQSLEACFPANKSLPPEYYEMLIPSSPVHEQQLGAMFLLIGQIVIFGLTLGIPLIRKRISR